MDERALIFSTRSGSAPHAPGNMVTVRVSLDAPVAESAAAVAEALRAAGWSGRPAVLAIPSGACLCAPIRTHDLPAKDRRRALLYRLEEKVPVSAEDMVADFVHTPGGALGICVLRSPLASLVLALEDRGVPIEVVCPTSLLAMQHQLETNNAATDGAEPPCDAIALAHENGIELVLLNQGRPRAWSAFSERPAEILQHMKLESFNGTPAPTHVLAVVLPQAFASALETGLGARVTICNESPAEVAAAAMAQRVLSRLSEPWVNLRGGMGAEDRFRPFRGPLRYALLAAAVCLLSASAAMLWRAHRYDELAAQCADEQGEIFRRTFPMQPMPPDVRSRLDSEERGLRGVSGAASVPPPQSPGLLALRDLLGRLPQDVRFRVLELRLDGSRFAMDGQVRSHGDADTIAASLRAGGGFQVDPPRTEQLSGPADGTEPADGSTTPTGSANAVAFTLTGTINTDAGQSRRPSP